MGRIDLAPGCGWASLILISYIILLLPWQLPKGELKYAGSI